MIPTIPIEMHGCALEISVQFDPSRLCPVTDNPQLGSAAQVTYTPAGAALKPDYIRPELLRIAADAPRSSSMEEVFALLAVACATAAGVPVALEVRAIIHDGTIQTMCYRVNCNE